MLKRSPILVLILRDVPMAETKYNLPPWWLRILPPWKPRIPAPWRRRIRALLIHIIAPVAVFVGFVLTTSLVQWHGIWTDSLVMIIILAVNTWSIWTAEWNAKLKLRWRIGISLVTFFVSFIMMNVIALNIRTNFG